MKTRRGFVSNSSTSCFLCDVCGQDASGYDVNLRDHEMFACWAGHVICEHHVNVDGLFPCSSDLTPEEMIQYMEKNQPPSPSNVPDFDSDELRERLNSDDREEILTTRQYIICLYEDFIMYLRDEAPLSWCPVCQLDVITKDDELLYLRKRCGITKEQAHKEINSRFKDLSDMYQKLGTR